MRFTLDSAALERIFANWNIPVPKAGIVLFALRGCTPHPPPQSSPNGKETKGGGWVKSVLLESVTPNYVHMRCTIGAWDRETGRIFAAPGSTVPHRDNVRKAAARQGTMKGRGTNQLEPGFYADLTKGEHLQGKPQGHAALRQTANRLYRRAPEFRKAAPLYTTRDPLFYGNPYDNLHCAWNVSPDQEGFRSSGCVVVAGWPHCPRLARLPDARPRENKNAGAWKTLHDLIYAAPQRKFPLLLLGGRDVGRALSGSGSKARLCFGSEGEAVRALQRRLKAAGFYKGSAHGRLDARTYRAWNAAGFKG